LAYNLQKSTKLQYAKKSINLAFKKNQILKDYNFLKCFGDLNKYLQKVYLLTSILIFFSGTCVEQLQKSHLKSKS
jgi:hypothetical protein